MSLYDDMMQLLEAVAVEEATADPRMRKQRRILEAASALFVRHGYRKTSVEDVARAAHTAKGTVYLYFATKADLLVQAVLAEKRKNLVHMRPVLEHPDPQERLRMWLVRLIEMVPEMPLTSRLLAGDSEIFMVVDELDANFVAQAQQSAFSFLARLIDEASPAELPKAVLEERARVLVSVFHSAKFFSDEQLRFGIPLDRFARLLADTLTRGVLESPLPAHQLEPVGASMT